MSKITVDAFNRLVGETPFGAYLGIGLEEVGEGTARVRLPFRPDLRRPGGAIYGPVIMAVADFAIYAVVMSVVEDGEAAVTTSMHIHFLRAAIDCDLIGEARLLKGGRRLLTTEVFIYGEGREEPVAHVTGTYVQATG